MFDEVVHLVDFVLELFVFGAELEVDLVEVFVMEHQFINSLLVEISLVVEFILQLFGIIRNFLLLVN